VVPAVPAAAHGKDLVRALHRAARVARGEGRIEEEEEEEEEEERGRLVRDATKLALKSN
jgi:hypothetical protein